MDLKPLGSRVIVKLREEEEVTPGGIVLPDTAKEKPQEADVVAVGEGEIGDDGTRTPVSVKPGDRVIVQKYAGTEVKVDGEEYLIVGEDDVLAVVE